MPKLTTHPTARDRWIAADRRTVRRNRAAVIVAVGAIAVGGYAVTESLLPGAPAPVVSTSVPAPSDAELARIRDGLAAQYGQAPPASVVPRGQALRELRDSAAGQYGEAPSVSGVVPRGQALRELRDSAAGQYGQAPSVGRVVASGRALRELRDSVAGQYGAATDRAPTARQLRQIRTVVAHQYGGR